MNELAKRLAAQIAQTGPMRVDQYMAACLYDPEYGYYTRRPAIGAEGDFITAPTISQMFGELVGLWCAHEWDVLGRPDQFAWIECGPGNGALISDAWRAARTQPLFRDAAHLHLVEVSPGLRAQQTRGLRKLGAEATWHEHISTIPSGPSLTVANEFLDCIPIRQFVRTDAGWCEKLVGLNDSGELVFGLFKTSLREGDAIIPPALHDAPVGAIAEIAPGLAGFVDELVKRLSAAPGRVLIIDYGGDGSGDTLQALQAHNKVDPLATPGEADLTAHVDFVAVKILARAAGLDVSGPFSQGEFLTALGIGVRAEALVKAHPERADRIARELHRLTAPDQMGGLFKVICLSSRNLPPPAGF